MAESVMQAEKADVDFILGMGKVNGSVKILLDIDKVLTDANLDGLGDQASPCWEE